MLKKGIYNIYKPKGPSSYDIIRQVKRDAEDKRVGHGGTLDPLASGVLIVAIGREYTKTLDTVVKNTKEYEATIKLGQSSTTQDEEGEKTDFTINRQPTEPEVVDVLKKFTGKIQQTPPAFSAMKINGQRAYKIARRGVAPEIKEREITIHEIKLFNYVWPIMKIKVNCSSGTYIRTLANDIGAALETGGYLADLIRTKIGNFKVDDSIHLDS
jgi:tRNA pseudouridine55 synthase